MPARAAILTIRPVTIVCVTALVAASLYVWDGGPTAGIITVALLAGWSSAWSP